ncbi:MAG: carboxylesterase family protein [Planctomycetota bacterium]|jgi:pimeloyl-ACP methyl ester carboxylesterase
MRTLLSLICLTIICLPVESDSATAPAEDVDVLPAVIEMTEALCIPRMRRGGRSIFSKDSLVNAKPMKTPNEGDEIVNSKGETQKWTKLTVNEKGWIQGAEVRSGYVYWAFESTDTRTMILEARGHSAVRVNGFWRAGDPYSHNLANVPVKIAKGKNELLFGGGRGRVKARLVAPERPVFHRAEDKTTPHILRGVDQQSHFAAVRVMNTKDETVRVGIRAVGGAVYRSYSITRCSVRKIPFTFGLNSAVEANKVSLEFELLVDGEVAETFDIAFSTAGELDKRRITFLSEIDGSVQYYGLTPARPLPGQTGKPGIVLALHGASVEGFGHVRAYGHKTWCHLVAPTNRRPFGFDWEDWGRLDAFEVLAQAKATFDHDPSKVYVTGHSMGGHGTWTLGAQFPDRFCAIAPCAGWQSFWTYGRGAKYDKSAKDTDVLAACANIHKHELLMNNYASQAVFVLHGDDDKTVPVEEARRMRTELAKFHKDLHWFEEPGKGHWYDTDPEPGANCVDYAPIFELFSKRRLPAIDEVRSIDFTTVWPGVSAKNHWASVLQQDVQLEPSRIQLRAMPAKTEIVGTVENVSTIELDVAKCLHRADSVLLKLNGIEARFAWPESGKLLVRIDANGISSADLSSANKNPNRCGMFKSVFDNDAVLVYGTSGSDELQAWAYNKVRYDAETMLSRGNASFEVVSDEEYLKGRFAGRNVVLYGNKDCNACWESLLSHCPLGVSNAGLSAESSEYKGSAAGMFVYPRAKDSSVLIGVVAASDMTGAGVLDRQNYFVSGISYPDALFLSPEVLENGEAGIIGATMFNNKWQLESIDGLLKKSN